MVHNTSAAVFQTLFMKSIRSKAAVSFSLDLASNACNPPCLRARARFLAWAVLDAELASSLVAGSLVPAESVATGTGTWAEASGVRSGWATVIVSFGSWLGAGRFALFGMSNLLSESQNVQVYIIYVLVAVVSLCATGLFDLIARLLRCWIGALFVILQDQPGISRLPQAPQLRALRLSGTCICCSAARCLYCAPRCADTEGEFAARSCAALSKYSNRADASAEAIDAMFPYIAAPGSLTVKCPSM